MSLPDVKELTEDLWMEVEVQLAKIDEQMNRLSHQSPLKMEDFLEPEWMEWRDLVNQTQQIHRESLAQLIHKKEVFYQDIRSVGKSVKANQAYNNMKRIRF